MTNVFMVETENKIHGIWTRLKELHFSAPKMSVHKLIDDFITEFLEFEDELMENSQAIFGFIEPGEILPELPEATEFEDLLTEIRGILVNIKREGNDSTMWTGILNITDDFFQTVNEYIYLVKITRKEK